MIKSDAIAGLLNAHWPVLLLDESGVIQAANLFAIRAFGPKLEKPPTPLSAFWPGDNESAPEQFLRQWELAPATALRLRLLGIGKAKFTYQACLSVVLDDENRHYLVQLFPEKTIAETKPATPTMDASLAHKQKLDCALQLARTVSLDFNNALTSILGHTSLILSKFPRENPWRPSLLEIEKSAAKAAEIANDLGAFSLNEKEASAQMSGNLNLLVERSLESFQKAMSDREISWSLDLERKLHAARFDEAKLQQALVKILENAVESLPASGEIKLQTKNITFNEATQDRNARISAGTYVCAEISDTGCGIEADVLPRIFEPFFTTKKATNHRGLGLTWVYGIVTNQGGAVAIASQPGLGTSVRIYLPADKKFIRDAGADPADLHGTETILMVDDEDLLLTMGETILSAYGYRVLTANNGTRALQILEQNDPAIDLLLTDLVMPNMTGRELVEKARKINPSLRVLSSSGYVRPAAEQDFESSFLQKPFNSLSLLRKVKSAIKVAG